MQNPSQPNPDIQATSFSLTRDNLNLPFFTLAETHLLKLTRDLKQQFGRAQPAQTPQACVIDLSGIESGGKWIDFPALTSLLKNYQLEAIGIVGGNEQQQNQAVQAGLPILGVANPAGSANDAPATTPAPAPQPEIVTKTVERVVEKTIEVPSAPMVIEQPVRSGSELYAQGRDMIVMNQVSAGARVVADGSIYIHGRLQGTAAAGASDMQEARIFCECFKPEIIAICGNFLDGEQLARHPAWGKRAVVYLSQGQIQIRSFE